ncbi:MAG: hypothetical protein IT563_20825 [Alphaproteobacteria bacterium]|nr:hypothetical protein [Alphaproteobacteria bacterium]
MDDTFRLDLAGYDRECVREVLDTFLTDAQRHGRRVVQIRMGREMCEKVMHERGGSGLTYRGVEVALVDTGFEETIEVVLTRIN